METANFTRAELEILAAALNLMLSQLEVMRLTVDGDYEADFRDTLGRTRDLLQWVEGQF